MRRGLGGIVPVVAGVMLAAGSVFAAHPLATDDTGTQGKGKFQLEVVGEYGHDSEKSPAGKVREDARTLESVFSAGLIDTIDLVLAVPYEWSRTKVCGVVDGDTDGLGDVTLELKWRFFEKNGFSLAFKPAATLPSGDADKGIGNGKVGYGATLIASHEFEPFAFHMNLGYAHSEFKAQGDCRRDIWSASVAGTAEVMKGLRLVANVGLETNPDKNSNALPVFCIAGAIYSVSEWLDIDLGVKVGLTKPETNVSLLPGLAVRF